MEDKVLPMLRKLTLYMLAQCVAAGLFAQVNAYAEITSISEKQIAVGSSNEVYAQFQTGDKVIIMQMQDEVIGSTANDATFGSLGNIGQAGMYSIATIADVSRSAGEITSITLTEAPAFIPTTGPNSTAQLISFQQLGSRDHTTTTDVQGLPWNGRIGGVVAINVDGTLTLAHDIIADGAGFRGGTEDGQTSTTCDDLTFATSASDRYAMKGEGIYKVSDPAYLAGKGRLINAGGGGNDHNGGGGGGANFSAGGTAGPGYNCGAAEAGGLGGSALGAHISGGRVFMGGGGGGGEGNNSVSTAGGNGGGIIIIHAEMIVTEGSCGGLVISANGASAGNAGNDGAGGGGAGGSVVIHANSIEPENGCALTIRANGGNGGSVGDPTIHGGGGGGGQGVIWFSTAIQTVNTSLQTLNGTGGCNNTSVPCNDQAESGQGSSGTGIITGGASPLPVELMQFTAHAVDHEVLIEWTTATEENSARFVVERSADGEQWNAVAALPAAGNSQLPLDYIVKDPDPLIGVSYYRLQQIDLDGSVQWSPIAVVHLKPIGNVIPVFPNPVHAQITVQLDAAEALVRLYDDMGRLVLQRRHPGGTLKIDVSDLPAGAYSLSVLQNGSVSRSRLMKH